MARNTETIIYGLIGTRAAGLLLGFHIGVVDPLVSIVVTVLGVGIVLLLHTVQRALQEILMFLIEIERQLLVLLVPEV